MTLFFLFGHFFLMMCQYQIFCKNNLLAFLIDYFLEYLPDYKNLNEMKEHYKHGGLGDGTCKKFLINVLEEILNPIRNKRAKFQKNIEVLVLGNI